MGNQLAQANTVKPHLDTQEAIEVLAALSSPSPKGIKLKR
jgi:hypothetical protein